jgi:hypothetical protein
LKKNKNTPWNPLISGSFSLILTALRGGVISVTRVLKLLDALPIPWIHDICLRRSESSLCNFLQQQFVAALPFQLYRSKGCTLQRAQLRWRRWVAAGHVAVQA